MPQHGGHLGCGPGSDTEVRLNTTGHPGLSVCDSSMVAGSLLVIIADSRYGYSFFLLFVLLVDKLIA